MAILFKRTTEEQIHTSEEEVGSAFFIFVCISVCLSGMLARQRWAVMIRNIRNHSHNDFMCLGVCACACVCPYTWVSLRVCAWRVVVGGSGVRERECLGVWTSGRACVRMRMRMYSITVIPTYLLAVRTPCLGSVYLFFPFRFTEATMERASPLRQTARRLRRHFHHTPSPRAGLAAIQNGPGKSISHVTP
ncbi:hypothetical protein EVAR_30311_1 [Eumeta japonica]|uniref:Uncharacterized protein n=1 Tax=Eumeta variegata TaxID=151549 RepID=A0A4C1WBS8_EUMVA|nr:hypothetical protein EVAR_30311_1 [Eumeta japonica]